LTGGRYLEVAVNTGLTVHLKNKIFPQKTISENTPLQEITVNTTLMTNVGTIEVDGFGPINIVTGGPNNVQVRLNFVEVKI
jgi:hypothetical protein